jgi:cell division protein FtsB
MLLTDPGEDGGKTGGLEKEHPTMIEEKMEEWTELQPEIAKSESDFEKMGDLVNLILERDQLSALLEERQRMGNESMVDMINLFEKLLEEKVKSKEEVSGLEKEIASLEEKLKDLVRQLKEIEDQTEDLVDANKQELRPPRAVATVAQQVLFMVRYDEVFPVQVLNPSPSGLIANAVNNTQSVRWEGDAAYPIQGSGLKIGRDTEKMKEVIEMIKRHNAVAPSEEVKIKAALIVYPDSFDSVGEFRELIQDSGGLREGWEPYLEDMALRVGAGGATVKDQ